MPPRGYSLQANRKVLQGSSHPDRNAQFEYLNGMDHDTATSAVESIRRWWQTMGKTLYPGAKRC